MAYKIITITDLKKMNIKDLEKEMQNAELDLASRTQHVRVGEDKQSHMIGRLRKYIARIKTIKPQTLQQNEK